MASLDGVINRFLGDCPPASKAFDSKKSVRSVSYFHQPAAETLAVIIPPWHAPKGFMEWQVMRQRRLGRSVLWFDFDENILSSDH